jgi:cell shape-determining protein MreC
MEPKLFTFNATSFYLDKTVESFLRSKSAISLDFGAAAYINSEAMPSVLSELLGNSAENTSSNESLQQLRTEMDRLQTEKIRIEEENTKLVSQARLQSSEILSLTDQLAVALKAVEALETEKSRLLPVIKRVPSSECLDPNDDAEKVSLYEKLLTEVKELRSQHADAIASLKVLEDENEELRTELEQLKAQPKPIAPTKAV